MAAKKHTGIDPEQRELIENAQRRIRQKKALMRHFVVFLAGAVLFIVLNVIFNIGEGIRFFNLDWYVWAILLWLFFLLIHFINVFIMNKFMGKAWEENQLEKLVAKQQKRINQLEKEVEKEIKSQQAITNTPEIAIEEKDKEEDISSENI